MQRAASMTAGLTDSMESDSVRISHMYILCLSPLILGIIFRHDSMPSQAGYLAYSQQGEYSTWQPI